MGLQRVKKRSKSRNGSGLRVFSTKQERPIFGLARFRFATQKKRSMVGVSVSSGSFHTEPVLFHVQEKTARWISLRLLPAHFRFRKFS